MQLKVMLVLLAVLASAWAEEGYAKETPAVPFNEGEAPSPSPAPSAASPATGHATTPSAPLVPSVPSPHGPYGIPGPYGLPSPVDVASRYFGSYPGTAHGFPGHLLGGYPGYPGYPVSAVPQDYASRWYGPVAIPVVLPDGALANTPEVAAARAQHLAALNRAKALWFGKYNDGSYNPLLYADHAYSGAPGYSAALGYAPASPVYSAANPGYATGAHNYAATHGYAPGYPGYAPGYPGYAAATYAATAHGYSAAPGYAAAARGYDSSSPDYPAAAPGYAAPSHGYAPGSPGYASWSGPLASPTVLPSGYLVDTPEITAARAAHLAALARAYEEAALWRSKAINKGWK